MLIFSQRIQFKHSSLSIKNSYDGKLQYLTNRFHVAMHLFRYMGQTMSNCGKNKKRQRSHRLVRVTLTAVRHPVGSYSVHTASKWLLKSMEMPLRSPRLFRGNIFNWTKLLKTLRQLDTKVSFHTKTHDNTTALYALFVHSIMPCSICSQPSLLTML